jgi:anthranilate/para-aminobenzoate synthase component II
MTTRGRVGARHPKEVARMIEITRTMTAQSPSFGVSAYGQTSLEATAIAAFVGAQVSTCARVRHIGGMGLATAKDFPGTSAWRPPSC